MVITFIASGSGKTNSGQADTAAANTTGADLILVVPADYNLASAVTPTENKSNTLLGRTSRNNAGVSGLGRIRPWYAKNASGGSGHTSQYASSTSYPAEALLGFAGSHLTSPYDQETWGQTGGGTSLACDANGGALTNSEDDQLGVAFLTLDGNGGDATINNSFNKVEYVAYQGGFNFPISAAYRIFSGGSGASVTPTWSWTGTLAGLAVYLLFKKAAAAGGTIRRNSSLSGLGASGRFFHDPLSKPDTNIHAFVRKHQIFVPRHVAQGDCLERAA